MEIFPANPLVLPSLLQAKRCAGARFPQLRNTAAWVEPGTRHWEPWDDVLLPWESMGVLLPASVEPGVHPQALF